MKKLLCPLFALLIVLSLSTAAFAADYSAEESANALYELGLFQGTGETANGKPIYSLDAAPTRAQTVTMLVRLLGKEAEAKAGTWTVPFSDLADWARSYVGYAYANGLTNGLSAERFGSDDKVTANQYLTFILRALGYSSERDFQWDKANAFSDSLGLTHGEYRASRSFTRGDTARISFAALAQARKDSSETLAAQLVRQGAVFEVNCGALNSSPRSCKSASTSGSAFLTKRGRQISGRLRRCADAVGQAICLVCLARRG